EAVLLRRKNRRRWIAIFVEVLCKSSFASRERDEVDGFSGLGIDVPVFFHAGIACKTEAFLDASALAGIVNENRETSRICGKLGLMFSHVVGYAVFRLAGCIDV